MVRAFEEEPSEGQSWTVRGVSVTDETAAQLLATATGDETARVVSTLRSDESLNPNAVVVENVEPKERES